MSQASENMHGPLQVQIDDHQVVAVVWRGMQDLLASNHLQSETFVRQLSQLLPSLTTVAPDALPAIARIHLQSATHISNTMKLIAPEAYTDNSSAETGSTDNISGADPTGGLVVAASSPAAAAAAMLTKLIDLQIFHLVRARGATAHMRAHAAARRRAEAVAVAAAAAAAGTVAVGGAAQTDGPTGSSSSSSSSSH